MNPDGIKAALKHVDQGELNYVDATLAKDPANSNNDALIEVYRRLRPGDLATVDNARSLLENMFYNFKRLTSAKLAATNQ